MKAGKPYFVFRKWEIIIILLFPIQWVFFSFISKYPEFIENWYSNGLYKFLSLILRGISFWIPFSIGEILIYILILFILFRFVRIIIRLFRKQIRFNSFVVKLLAGLLSWISVIYFLFMILWGLNYHRERLIAVEEMRTVRQDLENQDKEKQGFEKQDIERQVNYGKGFSTTELTGLCEKLIRQTNDYRMKAIQQNNNPNTLKMENDEIIKQAYSGFQNINIERNNLAYKLPSVKKILFTSLFSYLGIGGIYNPFTGEANVNMDPPDFLLPATTCHEMAHQAGISPEDEANYISYIVCRQHSNPLFQYSGTLMAMRYAMSALKQYDQIAYKELQKQISDAVQNDLKQSRKYWSQFKNPFEKYSDRIYDNYLKANNQKAGIKSYSHMVNLLLYDYAKNKMAKE